MCSTSASIDSKRVVDCKVYYASLLSYVLLGLYIHNSHFRECYYKSVVH